MGDFLSFSELYYSYELCLKNKKKKSGTYNFVDSNLCQNLYDLLEEINNRKYVPSSSNCYVVKYPAYREIFAAQFKDRVVQHFYMNELGDILNAKLVKGCSSCIKNRGTAYALGLLKKYVLELSKNGTEKCYYLKIDLSGYFMSIKREIVCNKFLDLINQDYKGKHKELLLYLTPIIFLNNPVDNCIYKCIEKIDLDKSKDLSNNYFDEKNGRLDIRATLNGNIDCDIEMQVIAHKKILERMLYYWAKMYVGNLSIGEPYVKLKKAISIIIMDQEIEELKELPAHTTWRIKEDKMGKQVLTDDLEIHIIELKKVIAEYEKDKDNELLQWMMFLNNPENSEVSEIMKTNNDIKEAKVELEKISQDEAIRRQALNEEIARRDYEQGMIDAEAKGRAEGETKGRAEGEAKERNIIKNLSSMGMPLSDIAKATELSEAEVSKIINGKD